MARPKKIGIDYFPFDVDFFEDEKIVAISGEFGIKGELTAIKLLCAIYRNGYFIEWSEMLQMKMLKSLPGVSVELLNTIVLRLVKWGFFDKDLFDSTSILTSVGIQKRYFDAVSRRIKGNDFPYLLVSVNIISTETPLKREFMSTETTQIKRNKKDTQVYPKSTELNNLRQDLLTSDIWRDQVAKTYHLTQEDVTECINGVVDYVICTSPYPTKSDAMRLFPKQVEIFRSTPKGTIEERKNKFTEEMKLANKDKIYPIETMQAFFRYWTQMSRDGDKMAFENQPFWDTTKRLALWKD